MRMRVRVHPVADIYIYIYIYIYIHCRGLGKQQSVVRAIQGYRNYEHRCHGSKSIRAKGGVKLIHLLKRGQYLGIVLWHVRM